MFIWLFFVYGQPGMDNISVLDAKSMSYYSFRMVVNPYLGIHMVPPYHSTTVWSIWACRPSYFVICNCFKVMLYKLPQYDGGAPRQPYLRYQPLERLVQTLVNFMFSTWLFIYRVLTLSVSCILGVYIRICGMFLHVCFHINVLARNHRSSIADALELRGLALNHGYTAYYASMCACAGVYVCVCLFYWFCILLTYLF